MDSCHAVLLIVQCSITMVICMLPCSWWIRSSMHPGQMLVTVIVHCGIGALGNPQYLPSVVADGVDVPGTASEWGCQMLVTVVVHCGIGAFGTPKLPNYGAHSTCQPLPSLGCPANGSTMLVADGVDVPGTASDWGCVAAVDNLCLRLSISSSVPLCCHAS
jgi:hypothetical protein